MPLAKRFRVEVVILESANWPFTMRYALRDAERRSTPLQLLLRYAWRAAMSEVTTIEGRGLQTLPRSALVDRRANPLLTIDAVRPTSKVAEGLLQVRGIEATAEARALDRTEKLTLTANLDRTFDATPQEQALHGDFHDAIRGTWAKLNPLSPEAISRIHSFADAVRNSDPSFLPTANTAGAGFVLSCTAGSGGLRFVERTTEMLGSRLRFLRLEDATEVPYWPAMVVHWPACGTHDAFQANFMAAFDGNTVGSRFFRTVFRPAMKRVIRPIFVCALAAMANLGVLFVVGANSSNFDSQKSEKLLLFLQEFMATTGIPVVFVCTPPVYERLLYMGSLGASLMSGGVEEIQWLTPTGEFFTRVNLGLMNQGLAWGHYDAVPDSILSAAAALTHGSREGLYRFHKTLQIAAIRDARGREPEQLLDGVAKTFARQTEQLQFVGQFLQQFHSRRRSKDAPSLKMQDVSCWADFLSRDVYRTIGALA